MTKPDSPVTVAFERASALDALIRDSRQLLARDPYHKRLQALGPQGKKLDRKELERTHDELQILVDHMAILSMASAFEKTAKAKISSRIGETQSALSDGIKKSNFKSWHHGQLVKKAENFSNLFEVFELLSGVVDTEISTGLKLIRGNRNHVAHGADASTPPSITRVDACRILNEALDNL